MENVSTGVLEKNKEQYSKCKDKAEKWYDVSGHIQLHMSKYKQNEDMLSIMSNQQPNHIKFALFMCFGCQLDEICGFPDDQNRIQQFWNVLTGIYNVFLLQFH